MGIAILTEPLCKNILYLSMVGLFISWSGVFAETNSGDWYGVSHRAVLRNNAIEATFQAGMLCSLKDCATGKTLLFIDPAKLPSQLLIFDTVPTDMNACKVATKVSDNSVETVCRLPNGDELLLRWSVEQDNGDLILQVSSRTAKPITQIRYTFFGCDITEYAFVWVSAYGAGHVMRAPWNGIQLGDPQKDNATGDGTPGGSGYPNLHPLVALFQGENSGWFVEGRDARPGPSNVLARGIGSTVNVGMVRRFPIAKLNPELYEIRIRTYKNHWEDAVDPYVAWLEKDAGYVPIDNLPREQAWVKDIRTQSYISVGDFNGLDAMAGGLDHTNIMIGRMGGFTKYVWDSGYPDYRLTDAAKKWMKHAHELGFHVGMHFNSNGICTEFPALVEKFKPGFAVTGKDANGSDMYESIYGGRFIRCSPAYKPWRDYLIAQMKDAVDAGVDIIYLDESMTATGKFLIDGTDGVQGMQALMRETLQAYPHVAIETEQFNLLTAKYGKFALSQMPLGHPLAGYIFQRYVKVVPEGIMITPTESQLMDAFDCWGFMLPGSTVRPADTWTQIAEAYHKYNLIPDSRLPRKQITHFENHPTGGVVPVYGGTVPPEGIKLFGFRGANGVTAYFEKHPTKRGLVIYEPSKQPIWVGTRITGVTSWPGPGALPNWTFYNGSVLLALDPNRTYLFDESIKLPQDAFHITKVPTDYGRHIQSQEVGENGDFYKYVFSGNGSIEAYVPDDYDVYLDGQKLEVDRIAKTVSAVINASLSKKLGDLGYFIALKADSNAPSENAGGKKTSSSMLLAFKRTDTELKGKWVSSPWQRAVGANKGFVAVTGDGFFNHVNGKAYIVGRLPNVKSLRLKGAYGMFENPITLGDGHVRINGAVVLRVPPGDKPYQMQPFDVDISAYAGQYVLFEFGSDGSGGPSYAGWTAPEIVAEP